MCMISWIILQSLSRLIMYGVSLQFAAPFWWYKWNWFVTFIKFHIEKKIFFFLCTLQEHKTGHAIEMVKPLILMFWSFVQVFMFCDFGENVTGGFEALNDAILENDWYTFPIEIQ